MIDDISLMEVAANGSPHHVLDFLHYCHTLISEFVRQSANHQFLDTYGFRVCMCVSGCVRHVKIASYTEFLS